jgi:predicted  nucleic acid-binding Zn-ribbon protein
MKITPSLLAYLISPQTGRLWSYLQLPPLTTGKVWVGNEDNVAVESEFSPLGDYLPEGQVYVGNEDNVATPSQTISMDNLPDLGVATVEGLDLPAGKVWRGTELNRPEESDALSVLEADVTLINLRFLLAHFVMNNPGVGDSLRVLMPGSQFLVDLGLNTIPKVGPLGILIPSIPGVDYVTLQQLEEWVQVIQDEIDALVNDIAQLQAELVVINEEIDAIMAELTVINDEIAVLQGDVAQLEIEMAAVMEDVMAIQAELVVINGEIDAIQAELVVITADIATIQGQIVVIQGQIATLFGAIAGINTEITAIWAAITALQAQIAGIGIDIDFIFNDLEEIHQEIDLLREQVFAIQTQLTEHIAQADILFEDLSNAIFAVNVRIDDLRLNTIPADDDVSIYGYRLINVAPPILGTDAVNKDFLDEHIHSLPITLEGFVEGGPAVDGIIETIRGPDCLLTNIPAGGDVSMDDYRITDIGDPQENFDAVSLSFMWRLLNGEVGVEWAA